MNQKKTLKAQSSSPQVNAKRILIFFAAVILFVTGCKKETIDESMGDNTAAPIAEASKVKAPVVIVQPGSSIQAAINSATQGSVIKIQPGTYRESIAVNKADVTIKGEGNVVLENPGSAGKGIIVTDGADGFSLENLTIQNFGERAVDITHIDNFSLSHVKVINNGEFGLFVEYCNNGTIEHSEGIGHSETGVFVGQSTNVTVTQNQMHENVIGLEVENSSHITFDKNHSFNNAVGILCLLVPGRTVTQSSDIIMTKNHVRENNHANFSAPPEQESVLPSGMGILILGVDNVLVKDNHVTGNKFTGITAVSTLIMALLANIPLEAFAGIEPNPDGLKVISNQVKDNAFAPPAGLPLPGVDLLWDGSGAGNCWSRNLFTTSYPSTLPACP